MGHKELKHINYFWPVWFQPMVLLLNVVCINWKTWCLDCQRQSAHPRAKALIKQLQFLVIKEQWERTTRIKHHTSGMLTQAKAIKVEPLDGFRLLSSIPGYNGYLKTSLQRPAFYLKHHPEYFILGYYFFLMKRFWWEMCGGILTWAKNKLSFETCSSENIAV